MDLFGRINAKILICDGHYFRKHQRYDDAVIAYDRALSLAPDRANT